MVKKENGLVVPDEVVINKIYLIRNQKVMLDVDLAELYQVETKVLNQQVKRNIKRFPDDFMFQLTLPEFENLKSQIVTSSWGGTRKLPFVFTEQGLAMLSGVLNSDRAIAANIQIMRIFTRVRNVLLDNTELRLEIEKIKTSSTTRTRIWRSSSAIWMSWLNRKKIQESGHLSGIRIRGVKTNFLSQLT